MSILHIKPSILKGTVVIPSSKSITHRALICSFLSGEKCDIYPLSLSDDILATVNAINNINSGIHPLIIDCNESGSTLRFLKPILSALQIDAKFICKKSLSKRIMFDFDLSNPGEFKLPGNISSQFVSGLLMALPLLNGDSKIILTSPLESKPYIGLTIDVMKNFGVQVIETKEGFKIKGNQKYVPTNYFIEGDWSQAAFFIAAGAIGSQIRIKGLNKNSLQGDTCCVDLFSSFGANISWDNDDLIVSPGKMYGINIDARDIPDLVPALAIVASLSQGETIIKGVSRLKFKECDRINALIDVLRKLGANINKINDALEITGVQQFNGGIFNGYNDHRIVMAISIAATKSKEDVYIKNAESVKKSYPAFFNDYKSLKNAGYINKIN